MSPLWVVKAFTNWMRNFWRPEKVRVFSFRVFIIWMRFGFFELKVFKGVSPTETVHLLDFSEEITKGLALWSHQNGFPQPELTRGTFPEPFGEEKIEGRQI